MPPSEIAVELRAVSKRYRNERRSVLDGVAITVRRGEFVAIIGASGSGKSTLLNILGLLDGFDTGEYRLFGQDVTGLREYERNEARRDFFGFVLQAANTLDGESALRNAALGLRAQHVALEQRWQRTMAALEQVGMREYAEQPAKTLSGGQRQRVAFARAVATNPSIILADEPTGNLDPDSAKIVAGYLRQQARKGKAVILVTHDLEIAQAADRIERLENGKLHGSGVAVAPVELQKSQQRVRSRTPKRVRLLQVLRDVLFDAVSSASLAPVRTLMLIAAFALSIGGLIAAAGISQTASVQVAQRFATAANDEVRVSVPVSVVNAQTEQQLTRDAERLAGMDEVHSVGVMLGMSGNASAATSSLPEGVRSTERVRVVAGGGAIFAVMNASVTPPSAAMLLNNAAVGPVAIVASDALEKLNLPPQASDYPIGPGYAVEIAGRIVPVIGVFHAVGASNELSGTVVTSYPAVSGGYPNSATLIAKTSVGFPPLVAKAAPYELDAANPGSYQVELTAQLANLQGTVSGDLGALVAVVSGLLLVLIVFGAGAVMAVAVSSRKSEIALRRVLGTSKIEIAWLFIFEGSLLGTAGGLLGSLLGLLALQLIANMQGWSPVVPFWTIAAAPLLGAVAGLLSAVLPSARAAGQQPAIAIRG